MKTNKIENRITYIILTFACFLFNFKNITFLSFLFGSLLALLFIFIAEKINLYHFKLTKFLMFLLANFFLIFYTNKLSYFITDNILREYSTILISFTILLTIFILAKKGYHTIIKVILLASYFLFFFSLLGVFLTLPYINIENITNISLKSNNLFLESLNYAFLLIYSYFLIYPITKTKFHIKDFFLSIFYQLFTFLLVIFVLGSNLTKLYQYPYIVIFKKVNLIGFIQRIEIIFSMNYLFFFFFLLLLSFYQITYFLKKYIKKDKKINFFLILITIFIFLLSTIL